MNRKKIRNLYIKLTGPITFFQYFKSAIAVSKEQSYFPEMKRKLRHKRAVENLIWLAKYHEVNDFYNLYGFDIENYRNQKEYIDNYSFYLSRGDANRSNSPVSQTCILRDKLLFYEFMQFNGFPVPKVFAVIENGNVCDLKHASLGDSFLKDKMNYFIKDRGGECASFVKHINDYNDFVKLKPQITGEYIVQDAILQCSKMNELNPNAINTLRIVTYYNNGNPCVLGSILRIGTVRTGCVDNTSVGGIAASIQENGYLNEAIQKPKFGAAHLSSHPDTGIVFKDFQIPFYAEAVALVCNAHKCFDGLCTIGWDVALTVDGPAIIEGNDNWEIQTIQALYGGIREKWNRIVKN